ncbi:MAG: hypothetical protein ABI646_08135 [Acidobacteriota bacterium]
MRRTTYADEKTTHAFSVLEDTGFASIAVREDIALEPLRPDTETRTLDLVLTVIKWCFLYLPGTAALHFAVMAMSLFFFYGSPSLPMVVGNLGGSVVAVFMVMLGVGRLNDLRYLRVIAGILATSALASIVYSLSILFFPGDFFGLFTLLTMPLAIIIGQLIKIKTDRESLAP